MKICPFDPMLLQTYTWKDTINFVKLRKQLNNSTPWVNYLLIPKTELNLYISVKNLPEVWSIEEQILWSENRVEVIWMSLLSDVESVGLALHSGGGMAETSLRVGLWVNCPPGNTTPAFVRMRVQWKFVYETMRRHITEGCHLHIRRRKKKN